MILREKQPQLLKCGTTIVEILSVKVRKLLKHYLTNFDSSSCVTDASIPVPLTKQDRYSSRTSFRTRRTKLPTIVSDIPARETWNKFVYTENNNKENQEFDSCKF